MEKLLFRQEVFEKRASRSLGAILLVRPISMHIAGWTSVSLAVALLVFLTCCDYTAKVRVTGRLVPATGIIRAVTPQFGRITQCRVREGMQVKAGQVLYELSSERASADRNVDAGISATVSEKQRLLDQMESLTTEQLRRRSEALAERRRLTNAAIERLEQEILFQKRRTESSEKILKRYQALRDEGFVSELQTTQRDSEYGDQQSRLQSLERSKLESLRDREQTTSELEQLRSQIIINAVESRRSRIELDHEAAEQSVRTRFQVMAPQSGTITTLNAVLGETVVAGTPLAAVLAEKNDLQAQLLAPSLSIGLIAPGQSVRLRVAAFPHQKFGDIRGTVAYVEQIPQSSGVQSFEADPMYRIIVQIEKQAIDSAGKRHPFLAGMSLEADIRQDRRKLIRWLFDPLIAAATQQSG